MPHTPQRQVSRGPGTVDPEFTSQVAVEQAGPAAVVQETEFERLERSLINIGSGLAGALGSLAQQQRSLGRMKDQAVARHERMIQSVRQGQVTRHRSLQQRRLQDVQNNQLELLLQAEQHHPEWLFRQSRIGFNNSASVEEQAMWSELLLESRKLADKFKVKEEQENENDIIQQFAMAGQTATVAVSEMVSNLQGDPSLQNELMGNGVGIHQRVQDWIISAAADAAPEIFNIARNDPDRELKLEQRDQLIAELVEKSLRVGDGVVRQHTRRSESTSLQTGTDLIGSQLLSYFEGKIGAEALFKSLEDTGRLHFNHLPEVEQERKLKQFLADSIEMATSGQFGTDVGEIETQVVDLVDKSGFNELEAISVFSNASDRLSEMVVNNYVSMAQEAKLSRTVEIPFLADDGTMQRRSVPDPQAHVTLSLPSDVDGRTEYDRLADRAIIEAGLDGDPSEMSPTQLAAVTRIRELAQELNEKGQSSLSDIVQQQNNIRGVLDGDLQASASDAYDHMILTRTFSNSDRLAPHQLRAILEQDKIIRAQERQALPKGVIAEPQSRLVWDGIAPLEFTPETRTLRRAVNEIEASAWDKPGNIHKIPDNLLGDMQQKWTRGNPEMMMDVMFFTSSLSESRQQEIYDSFGEGSSQTFALRNAIHSFKLAANNIELAAPLTDLMDRARQTMTTQDPNQFLAETTSFAELAGEENRTVASQAFAEVLSVAGLKTATERGGFLNALPNVNPANEHRTRMTDIQAAFMGPTKPIMDRMFGRWAVRIQRTNNTPVEAATWVMGQMRSEGFHIVNFDGEATMVQDIMQHFGSDDPRVRGAIGKDRRILTGFGTSKIQEETVRIQTFTERVAAYVKSPLLPWQRSVIQQALQLSPSETPRTVEEIYTRVPHIVNPNLFLDSRGNLVEGMTFVVSDGTNNDAQFTLRKTAADFGGVILQPLAFDGRLLPVARALQDVEYEGPDGEMHILRRDEPISLFTDQLFDSVVNDLDGPPANQQFVDDAMLDTSRRFDFGGIRAFAPSFRPFFGREPLMGRRSSITPLPGAGVLRENADGTVSSELSIGVNIGGREFVIPTLINGVEVSVEEAIKSARQRGLSNFPSFATIAEAERFAQQRTNALDQQR